MEDEAQPQNTEIQQENDGATTLNDAEDPTDLIPAVASLDQYIELERAKRKQRAERFGIEVHEPNPAIVAAPIRKRYRNTRPELTEEEKQKKEQRALRFGLANPSAPTPMTTEEPPAAQEDDGMMDVDIREERQDVNAFVPRRLDTIHIYGTDDLDTAALFAFFKDFNPQFAEWINDSSCNIVFKDQDASFNALEALSKPMDNFATLVPEGADEATIAKLNLGSYSWREAYISTNKRLLLRIATTADIRPVKPKPSVYYKKLFNDEDSGRGKRPRLNEKYVEVERLDRKPKPTQEENRKQNNNKGRRQRKGRGLDADGDIQLNDQELEKRKRRQQRFFPSLPETEGETTTASTEEVIETNTSDVNTENNTENAQ